MPYAGGAPQGGEPTSEVELSIECTGLRDMDTLSKSDPMCVAYALEGDRWTRLGSTEIIWDNLNPKWAKTFEVRYYFEREQQFKFEVYDIDDESQKHNLQAQDFIGGTAALTLAEIITAASGKSAPLLSKDGRNLGHGEINITGTEHQGGNDVVNMNVRGIRLAALDWFGSSDPILVIHRGSGDGRWIKVWESEPIKNNVNPNWKPFSVPARKMCASDLARPILLEVLDWERSGAHRPIGYYTTTVSELSSAGRHTVTLRHPQGKEKDVGALEIVRCDVEVQPSFVDYLRGGCEVSLMIAVDFTASNGNARNSNSLHFLGGERFGRQNDYQATIEKVGSILAAYDHDGLVPAFGFGARFPNGEVSHCFNLNGQASPECNGIPEVMHYYKQAVENLELYGPTNFSDFISHAAQIARDAQVGQENQEYHVLMIVTDGVITDMQKTISTIVAASDLPLSIVIVGVGNADFDAMDVLDADDEPLRCQRTRQLMKRDIVQFVPYRDFKHVGIARLAEEVLQEIPEQLMGFMKSKGILPNGDWRPPVVAPVVQTAQAAAGTLQRTASGRIISAERQSRMAAGGALYEEGVTASVAEQELNRVRAMIAASGGDNGVSHEGWLGIEGVVGEVWERRWARIVMRTSGAVLQLGFDTQRHAPADDPAWTEIPLTTAIRAKPWPKTRRAVAPACFRINVPAGSLASLNLPIADPEQAKLVLDPETVEQRDAWMHALAAALAVAPEPVSGGAAMHRGMSSAQTGGLIISVPTVSLEKDASGADVAKFHIQCLLASTGATTSALRSFDDFLTCRTQLQAIKPGVRLPELPRRRLFHAMTLTQSVMEERREHFETYLHQIALMPAFSGERIFRQFVGLS